LKSLLKAFLCTCSSGREILPSRIKGFCGTQSGSDSHHLSVWPYVIAVQLPRAEGFLHVG
jgi:hypothetical protein